MAVANRILKFVQEICDEKVECARSDPAWSARLARNKSVFENTQSFRKMVTSGVSWNVASKDSTARMPMRTTNASPRLSVHGCSFWEPPILRVDSPESLQEGSRATLWAGDEEDDCTHECFCWVTTLVAANGPQHTVAIAASKTAQQSSCQI